MNSPKYIKFQKQLQELNKLAKILEGFHRFLIIFKNLKLTYDNIDLMFITHDFCETQELICKLLKNVECVKKFCTAYEEWEEKNDYDFLQYTVHCKFILLNKDLLFELKRRQVLLHEKTVKKVLNQLSLNN